jgi:hypothetical protein
MSARRRDVSRLRRSHDEHGPAAVLRRRILAASAPLPRSPSPTAESLRLDRGWTLWVSNRLPAKPGRRAAPPSFTDPQRGRSFDNIAEYWRTINSFPTPSKLIVDCNMWIFQSSTEPTWEHPDNVRGGRWTFSIDTSEPAEADRAWLALHTALVGETLDAAYDVCGIALARRRNYIRMSVWTRDRSADAVVLELGRRIKPLARTAKLEYQDHGQAFEVYRHVI